MTEDGQKAEASASGAKAANLGDVDISDQGKLTVQSDVEGHTKPKPHNTQGTQEFNGLAFIFQLLSNYISPGYFDRLFGGSTVLGGAGFLYWLVTSGLLDFPNAEISVQMYPIVSIMVFFTGLVYLALRSDSQCPECETPFALRRTEYEVDRDKLSGQPDDLLIQREISCTQCEHEDEKTFWKPDPAQQTPTN